MAHDHDTAFLAALKRYAAPVTAFFFLLGLAATFQDYVTKLGWRVTAIIATLLAFAWAVHVFAAKTLSSLEPRTLRPKYSRSVKLFAIAIAAIMIIPVWFAIQPVPEFSIPPLNVRVVNPTAKEVRLSSQGEFILTAPETPAMDVHVTSGRLRLRSSNFAASASSLIVPANGELSVLAGFPNPGRLEALLASRELSLRLVLYREDGRMLTKSEIPFDVDEFGAAPVVIEIQP